MNKFAKIFSFANDKEVLVFKDLSEKQEPVIVFMTYHGAVQNKMSLGYKNDAERNQMFEKVDKNLAEDFLNEGMKLQMPEDKKFNKSKLYRP